jgi:hypothetical protein
MHRNYYRHQENNHADSLPQRAPKNPNFPPFPPVAVDEAEKAGPPPRPTSPPDRVRTKTGSGGNVATPILFPSTPFGPSIIATKLRKSQGRAVRPISNFRNFKIE